MNNGDVNLLLFGSVNEHHRVPINKQLYINKANFLLNFLPILLGIKLIELTF